MAMSSTATSRQQPSATSFPAGRSSHRRSGLTNPFLRCAGRPSEAISCDSEVVLPGLEIQSSSSIHESFERPQGAAIPAAPSLASLELAALDEEDEDEDDDLEDDDDLLDDDEDEDDDLEDDEDDEDEDDEDDEEDDFEDLDDEEDEDEDDEDDE